MVKIVGTEFYSVYIDDDAVAKYMPLQFALILVKAIYSEFYAEPKLRVTIEKMQLATEAVAEEVDKNE